MSGEINVVMDEGEVVLKAGDILVQCGTNHTHGPTAQSRRATVCFVLVDGEFDPALAAMLPK